MKVEGGRSLNHDDSTGTTCRLVVCGESSWFAIVECVQR